MREAQRFEDGIRVVLHGAPETAAAVNATLVRAGVGVLRLEPVRHSLEQRFLEITARLDEAPAGWELERHPRGGADMTAIALRMTGADFLKIRKKRGTVIWALVLALAPIIVFLAVKAIQHSSNPHKYEPAGGTTGFSDGLRVLALFFDPLAVILIGVEAGAGDASAGVFRDLVVTAARAWHCSARECPPHWR